jgi:hypothetical protein
MTSMAGGSPVKGTIEGPLLDDVITIVLVAQVDIFLDISENAGRWIEPCVAVTIKGCTCEHATFHDLQCDFVKFYHPMIPPSLCEAMRSIR